MRCPDRAGLPVGPLNEADGVDQWRDMPDGTRTCSFCGSLHEDDFIDIVKRYLDGEAGYKFDYTTKNYKFYANRPGVKNASDGGIKFYISHVDRTDSVALADRAALVARAVEKARVA